MSRTLTATLQAEVDARVTKPGYLVELAFSTPLRLSSRGDINVLGSDWEGYAFRIDGISSVSPGASVNPTIAFPNSDLAIGALILSEGVVGRAVTIWAFYGDSPTEDEVVPVFSGGVCTGAQIGQGQRGVTIQTGFRGAMVLRSPRKFVTLEEGFSIVPPKGAKITLNGEVYSAESED